MSLPLLLLTLSSSLATPTFTAPLLEPPRGPHVVVVTIPDGRLEAFALPETPEGDELVVTFTDPVRPPLALPATAIGDATAVLRQGPSDLDVDVPFVLADDDESCPTHASVHALGRWMLVLLAMVLVAAVLGGVSSTRRPLPLAAIAVRQPTRSAPVVERLLVLACLWSPMLMLLGLLQAEHEMLSSVLLCMAGTGAMASSVMLAGRRRLLHRLRWALEPRLDELRDAGDEGTVVKAEIEPRKLVMPPGTEGSTPWYRADLVVSTSDGRAEPGRFARVSLDGLVVDDEAARALVQLAMGRSVNERLTVLGAAHRTPADAAGAQPLDRVAPVQARISGGDHGPALLVSGSPSELAARLRAESAVLALSFIASIGAAALTLLN